MKAGVLVVLLVVQLVWLYVIWRKYGWWGVLHFSVYAAFVATVFDYLEGRL